MCAHMVMRDQWVFPDFLPLTDGMEPTAIGFVSPNSNSETHMTALCDARRIYGRGGFHGYLYAVQL